MLLGDTKGSSKPLYHLYENKIGLTEIFNFLGTMNVIEFIVYMSIVNPGIDPEINQLVNNCF